MDLTEDYGINQKHIIKKKNTLLSKNKWESKKWEKQEMV